MNFAQNMNLLLQCVLASSRGQQLSTRQQTALDHQIKRSNVLETKSVITEGFNQTILPKSKTTFHLMVNDFQLSRHLIHLEFT